MQYTYCIGKSANNINESWNEEMLQHAVYGGSENPSQDPAEVLDSPPSDNCELSRQCMDLAYFGKFRNESRDVELFWQIKICQIVKLWILVRENVILLYYYYYYYIYYKLYHIIGEKKICFIANKTRQLELLKYKQTKKFNY